MAGNIHAMQSQQRGAADEWTIDRTAKGLEKALDILKIDVFFDIRKQQTRWDVDGYLESTNARLEAYIIETIADNFNFGFDQNGKPKRALFGRDSWPRCRDALLNRRETDPFLDWLESLPPWDERRRLEGWLQTVFEIRGERNRELAGWASQFLFQGAVKRAFEPGAKLDEMPVFIGKQGIGKSTYLAYLFPEQYRSEWFADGLHLAADPKTRAEALQGRVVVEASEMAGSTRAELESLKSFLSRTDDGSIRLAYRSDPESSPRRCIIVGTTNNDECLPNDPTGNRRFLAVHLADGDPTRVRVALDEWRVELWAEAVWRHANGMGDPRFPDQLKTLQAEANNTARRSDEILEDAIERAIGELPQPFTLADLGNSIGMGGVTIPQRDQKRMSTVLIGMGFEKKQVRQGNSRQKSWATPINWRRYESR